MYDSLKGIAKYEQVPNEIPPHKAYQLSASEALYSVMSVGSQRRWSSDGMRLQGPHECRMPMHCVFRAKVAYSLGWRQ